MSVWTPNARLPWRCHECSTAFVQGEGLTVCTECMTPRRIAFWCINCDCESQESPCSSCHEPQVIPAYLSLCLHYGTMIPWGFENLQTHNKVKNPELTRLWFCGAHNLLHTSEQISPQCTSCAPRGAPEEKLLSKGNLFVPKSLVQLCMDVKIDNYRNIPNRLYLRLTQNDSAHWIKHFDPLEQPSVKSFPNLDSDQKPFDAPYNSPFNAPSTGGSIFDEPSFDEHQDLSYALALSLEPETHLVHAKESPHTSPHTGPHTGPYSFPPSLEYIHETVSNWGSFWCKACHLFNGKYRLRQPGFMGRGLDPGNGIQRITCLWCGAQAPDGSWKCDEKKCNQFINPLEDVNPKTFVIHSCLICQQKYNEITIHYDHLQLSLEEQEKWNKVSLEEKRLRARQDWQEKKQIMAYQVFEQEQRDMKERKHQATIQLWNEIKKEDFSEDRALEHLQNANLFIRDEQGFTLMKDLICSHTRCQSTRGELCARQRMAFRLVAAGCSPYTTSDHGQLLSPWPHLRLYFTLHYTPYSRFLWWARHAQIAFFRKKFFDKNVMQLVFNFLAPANLDLFRRWFDRLKEEFSDEGGCQLVWSRFKRNL